MYMYREKAKSKMYAIFKFEFSLPVFGKKVDFADCPASPWRKALSFI